MNQLKSNWKNLSKEIKWSIGIVATFIVVGSIIVGVSFGITPSMYDEDDTSSVVSSHVSEVSSITAESEIVSDVINESVSSQVVEQVIHLNDYSGYWYNSEDTERYEFKFTAIDAAHGEFSLGIFRLGALYDNCELTSNNVAAFSSDSGMSGTLIFNTYSIEVIINNPNQYWPNYILLDQSNGSSPLVINAPEVDYNDPAYVSEDAYGPNGKKYAADASSRPVLGTCTQCGITYYVGDTLFEEGVCSSCYESNHAITYCSACWNSVTDKSHEGFCESCWNKKQQGLTPGPDPNVWCPDCGTGYFVTGVGNDGIYCTVCQKNFMP